jgi:hypothetical protein
LTGFAAALEAIPGQEASQLEWRYLLGDDFTFVLPWLRRTGKMVSAINLPGVDLNIVRHSEDDVVGVRDDGQTVQLNPTDTCVLALNFDKLVQSICSVLGVQAESDAVFCSRQVRLIASRTSQGVRHPIYLVICAEPEDFERCLRLILDRCDDAPVVLAPTRTHLGGRAKHLVQGRSCGLLALDDLLGIGSRGRLVTLLPGDDPIDEGCRSAKGEPPRPDGVYDHNAIIWKGRSYRCDLKESEAAFLKIALVQSEIELTTLMDVRSGVIWKERYNGTEPQRKKIGQFKSRLEKALMNAQPPFPMNFTVPRGYDVIRRHEYTASSR